MPRRPRKDNLDLEAWFKKINMKQNQLATAAGLTSTYLNELRAGISRANRQKLLALGCAAGLDIENINELLTIFKLGLVDERDNSDFVEVAKRRKLSQNLQPLIGDTIYFLLLAVESCPGELVTVVDSPAYILRSGAYVEYEKRKQGHSELHALIVRRLHEERKKALEASIHEHTGEVYVLEEDMARYIKRYDYFRMDCAPRKHPNYILEHILHIFQFIKQHPNYRLYLVNRSHPFEFELKYIPEASKKTHGDNKLFFVGAEHADPAWMRMEISGTQNNPTLPGPSFLQGYATENKILLAQFNAEHEKIKQCVTFRSDQPDELAKLKEHILRLFKQETQISEDPDNLRLLDALLEE